MPRTKPRTTPRSHPRTATKTGILVLVFLWGLVACDTATDTSNNTANDATNNAASITANNTTIAKSQGLTFIHLNDTYRIGAVEDGKAGGFGRVVTILRELKQQGRDVRVLHGGDFLYPSLESQLWDGEQIVDAFNYMDDIAPMYVVAGNHEFDRRGPAELIDAVRASRFDWLGDNYEFLTGDEDVDGALYSAYMFEHQSEGQIKKIGFFSLTLHADDGGNARDYVPIYRDYVGIAESVIESLEMAGADLIIGLTHLHMWTDLEIAVLRERYPNFAFIVGGHEHEPEYHAQTDTSAAVMKGASNARKIWRIDVEFGADGDVAIDTEMLSIDDTIETDPGYASLEAKWRERLIDVYPFLTARIGEAAVSLDGREVAVRNAESNWGNLIVDQMLTAFGDAPADLAFVNSGTLRIDDYIEGDITFEDIARTFGFSSYLSYLMMSGAEFRATLEAGYRGSGPSKGYFPQVAGFRVCIDRSQPEGSRIVQLQVPVEDDWVEIDNGREYRVVAPEYLLGGGDGYRFPEYREPSLRGSELKYLVLDAIIRAQAEGRKVGRAIDPVSPRIAFVETGKSDCF